MQRIGVLFHVIGRKDVFLLRVVSLPFPRELTVGVGRQITDCLTQRLR